MYSEGSMTTGSDRQQTSIRRTAWVLLTVALAFFFGIILKFLVLGR